MVRTIIALLLAAALTPGAVFAGSIDDCLHAVEPDQKITGCTAIIECECVGDWNRAVAFIQRSIGLANQGDFQSAIEDLNTAINLEPENLNAHFVRGGAYNRMGEFAAAIQDYDKLYEERFYPVETLIARGGVYINMGEYRRAIDDYDEALRLDPENVEALNDRGTAYLQLGDFRRAIADFDDALRNDPSDEVTYQNRAMARVNMGDPAAAIPDARTAVEHLPDVAYVHQTLGLALCRDGQVEAAIGVFKQANEIDPPTPESIEMQLKRLAGQGFFDGQPSDRDVTALEHADRAWIVAGCPIANP